MLMISGLLLLVAAGSQSIREEVFDLTDGNKLRYTVAAPQVGMHNEPRPVVLALHYGWRGPFPVDYGKNYLAQLVLSGLPDLGASIVAPNCPAERWTDPATERVVLELLDHVIERYSADPDRVVLTGYSLGGMGTWYLSARHPDRFSAAVLVSARPDGSDDVEVPLYVIHSRADELLPIGSTEQAVVALQQKGRDVTLVALDGLTHYQTGNFVPALREAVKWIQGTWKQ